MPEPASSPEEDFMYSPPPPPHNLYWLLQRVLDMFGRLLVGVLICAMAVGLILLFSYIVYYVVFGGTTPHFVPR